MNRDAMKLLATDDLALLAKADRTAADVLLRRFEPGADTRERRQLAAFVTRRYGYRWLTSEDGMAIVAMRTWESLDKWKPETATFLTFLQGCVWPDLGHHVRSEKLHASRTAPLNAPVGRVDSEGYRYDAPGHATADSEETMARWRELTTAEKVEDDRAPVKQQIEAMRYILVLGLRDERPVELAARMYMTARAVLVNGMEVGEFAGSLAARGLMADDAVGRFAAYLGDVRRETASRWLASARVAMAKKASQRGYEERLMRAALLVTDDALWDRLRADAGLAGVIVEGWGERAA